MRNNMITTLSEDYVRMARAKGLLEPAHHVRLRGAQRDPAEPVRASRCRSASWSAGAILVEYVFNYPGVGLPALQRGEQPGLPTDAGAVPADHRRGARSASGRGHRRSRSSTRAHGRRVDGRAPRMTPSRRRSSSRLRRDRVRHARCAPALRRRARRNRKAIVGPGCCCSSSSSPLFPGRDRPRTTRPRRLPAASAAVRRAPVRDHGATARTSSPSSIWGTRQSLVIAVVGGLAPRVIAVLVGVTAAYLGGLVDGSLSLLTDVFLVIPAFPLIIVIATYAARAPALAAGLIVILTGWSYGARQLRAQALSLRNRDFLEAARVAGRARSYIIAYEIVPTMTSLIVGELPWRRALRGAVRSRPAVPRPRRPELASAGGRCSTGRRTTRRCRPGMHSVGDRARAPASPCSARRSPSSTTPSTRSATRRLPRAAGEEAPWTDA